MQIMQHQNQGPISSQFTEDPGQGLMELNPSTLALQRLKLLKTGDLPLQFGKYPTHDVSVALPETITGPMFLDEILDQAEYRQEGDPLPFMAMNLAAEDGGLIGPFFQGAQSLLDDVSFSDATGAANQHHRTGGAGFPGRWSLGIETGMNPIAQPL